MSVLKGILSESQGYYLEIKDKIKEKLSNLPQGSVKERSIAGKKYYYLQCRVAKKVVHKYLGKQKPEDLIKKVQLRRSLKNELKKIEEALKMLKRSKGSRRG